MGAVRCLFNESERCFVPLGAMYTLDITKSRQIQATALRYCIQGSSLYLPEGVAVEDITFDRRYCWARLRSDVIDSMDFDFDFNVQVPESVTLASMDADGIGLGARYMRRHREIDGRRVAVTSFCASSLIDSIRKNPEVLSTINKNQFEELCSELFATNGFEVDMYRQSKDDGIDFLAIRINEVERVILAVQCKHPDHERAGGKSPRSLPVTTVREIYGVAKANNLTGGVAITSAEYSRDAERFTELKPGEIFVYNRKDLLQWIEGYRWDAEDPKV